MLPVQPAGMRGLLLLPLLLWAAPGWAQEDPPACTPAREGMVACFAERSCVCRFVPGGQLTVRPAAHRWDCGILRPSCGVAPAGPPPSAVPPIGGYPVPYPGQSRPYPQ